MAKIIRKEIRKRGILGWIFLLLFVGFNLIMAVGLYGGLSGAAQNVPMTEGGRAGHAIGTAIGTGMILSIWVMGDIILGAFVLLTRGKKIITEETVA